MTWVFFHLPVAIILLGGGLFACFLGYRLLRTVLALYGFIGGMVIATMFVGQLETGLAVVVTIAGGVVGSVLAVTAYLGGVAVLGAGLGAVALNVVWSYRGGELNVWVVLITCFICALLTLSIRGYVLIIATSFGGAWTALVGGLALVGNSAAVAAVIGNVEQLPPVADARTHLGFILGWCGLGTLAVLVQMRDMFRRRLRNDRVEKDMARKQSRV
jgi:hypothetical protein